MATFKVDGVTRTPYPVNITWERPKLANRQDGAPVFSIFWEAVLTFPTMTTSSWYAMNGDFTDGALHTVQLPHPETGADQTYHQVYFEREAMDIGLGLYVYGATVRVKRITVKPYW